MQSIIWSCPLRLHLSLRITLINPSVRLKFRNSRWEDPAGITRRRESLKNGGKEPRSREGVSLVDLWKDSNTDYSGIGLGRHILLHVTHRHSQDAIFVQSGNPSQACLEVISSYSMLAWCHPAMASPTQGQLKSQAIFSPFVRVLLLPYSTTYPMVASPLPNAEGSTHVLWHYPNFPRITTS